MMVAASASARGTSNQAMLDPCLGQQVTATVIDFYELRLNREWSALFHAEHGERIDARRAARGNPARNECHTNHEHRHEH